MSSSIHPWQIPDFHISKDFDGYLEYALSNVDINVSNFLILEGDRQLEVCFINIFSDRIGYPDSD